MSKTKTGQTSKSSLAFIILGAIALIVLWLCALGHFSTGLLVFPLLIVLLFVILVPSVFTLFIIWTNDGYKDFINKLWSIIENISTKGLEMLQTIFPYVASIAGAIAIAAFVLSLVFFLKDKQNSKAKTLLIISSVILGLTIAGICVGAVTTYVI